MLDEARCISLICANTSLTELSIVHSNRERWCHARENYSGDTSTALPSVAPPDLISLSLYMLDSPAALLSWLASGSSDLHLQSITVRYKMGASCMPPLATLLSKCSHSLRYLNFTLFECPLDHVRMIDLRSAQHLKHVSLGFTRALLIDSFECWPYYAHLVSVLPAGLTEFVLRLAEGMKLLWGIDWDALGAALCNYGELHRVIIIMDECYNGRLHGPKDKVVKHIVGALAEAAEKVCVAERDRSYAYDDEDAY